MIRKSTWLASAAVLVAVWVSSARAEEPRPFFNELTIQGGGAYLSGTGSGLGLGAHYSGGLDFGNFGIEVNGGGFYASNMTGSLAGAPYFSVDLGLRLLFYHGKVAWKYGLAYVAVGTLTSASTSSGTFGTGWGVAPLFGIQYQSSREYPIYVGFGLDIQGLILRLPSSAAWGSGVGVTALFNLYLGVRLTLLEKIITMHRR